MKKVYVKILCVLVLLVAALVSCSKAAEKVNVLVAIPLTGDGASYGEVQKQGIEIALSQLMASSLGDKINVIYADTKLSPKEAVNVFQQNSAIANISAVLAISTGEVLALASECNKKNVVLLSPLASGDKISEAGDYVYRISPSDSFQGIELARTVEKDGHKSVAVLYANDAWGKGLSDKFVESYQKDDKTVTNVESIDPNETNSRTQLLKIKEKNPEAVVLILHPGEIIPTLKQFKELGLTSQIYGGDSFSNKSLYENAQDLLQGIKFTLPAENKNEKFQKFNESYEEKFKSQADINAAAAYDAIMIISEAINNGAKDGISLKKFFDEMKSGYLGATGMIEWDKNGDVVSKNYDTYIIKDGEYSKLN